MLPLHRVVFLFLEDKDNDITSYTVLLDTSSVPELEVGKPKDNTLAVTVNSGTVYYWKVITTDALGNASNSPIFQFAVH